MKERLLQLLDLEQLTPSKFADIIGVQRSSVSHVISGRNKPSFDFLQKTLKAFPGLNADWLMLGESTMYEQMGRGVPGNLFDVPVERIEPQITGDIPGEIPKADQIDDSEQAIPDPGSGNDQVHQSKKLDSSWAVEAEKAAGSHPTQRTVRKIVQVMVFYDDDTFRSFGPSQ